MLFDRVRLHGISARRVVSFLSFSRHRFREFDFDSELIAVRTYSRDGPMATVRTSFSIMTTTRDAIQIFHIPKE